MNMTNQQKEPQQRQAVTGKVFDISLLKRVLWFAMPYKKTLYFSLFLTILLAFLAPLRPLLIQYAFDNYIMYSDAEGLLHIIILMVGLLLIESVVQFYNTYLTNWLGQSVIKDLRLKVYKHITQFKLWGWTKQQVLFGKPIKCRKNRIMQRFKRIHVRFTPGLAFPKAVRIS